RRLRKHASPNFFGLLFDGDIMVLAKIEVYPVSRAPTAYSHAPARWRQLASKQATFAFPPHKDCISTSPISLSHPKEKRFGPASFRPAELRDFPLYKGTATSHRAARTRIPGVLR